MVGSEGRGDGRLMHPSRTPAVTIGLTLSTSSRTLDPDSTTPFYLIVTARILSTPRPSSPITLATHLNPFSPLPSKSFTDIVCLNQDSSISKKIEIYEFHWISYAFESADKKDDWDFVTIPASDPITDSSTREFVIKHEVSKDLIAAARVEKGERYRVAFTNECLGTVWWTFGDLEDMKNVRFVTRQYRDTGEKEGEDEIGRWYKGEISKELALVIEGEDEGAVEFEIGRELRAEDIEFSTLGIR